MIYLDSAATTLIKPPEVIRRTAWAVKNLASPGRGQYYNADLSEKIAYDCREKAAAMFGVSEPDNVVITFNATHGLNMAINTLAYRGCRTVVSGYEHNAVMRPLHAVGAEIITAESPLFDRQAAIDTFERAVTPDVGLVVCTAVSNVFGFVLPIAEIAELCRDRGVPLIIDASQAAGTIELDFTALGAAFMAMPGHKGLYGPQGTGLLLCSETVKPFMRGGTGGDSKLPDMPDYLPDAGEAGTHNMPGIAGLSAGLDFVRSTGVGRILRHEREMIELCALELGKIHGITVYSTKNKGTQSGVLSFTCGGLDCVTAAQRLARYGICVRAGLHCAPRAHETAGTLDTGTVRVSASAFTKPEDIYCISRAMSKIMNSARM